MSFDKLFQIEAAANKPKSQKPTLAKRQPKSPKSDLRGCEHCPLDKVEGINKVMGSMKGRKIWVIAQSPGPNENEEKKELVGPSGEWLWQELKRVGVARKDVDIQNVMRCLPADWEEGSYNSSLKMRNPKPIELKCCSIYNEQAIAQSKASHVLIFGKIAQQAILGRSIPKGKIFWSDKLQAKVYLLDHPSFFIRGYASDSRLAAFRKTLDELKKDLTKGSSELSDPFAFIKKQNYHLVLNYDEALAASVTIRDHAARGKRVAVDIEDYPLEDRPVVSVIGFAPKPGLSFVFILTHKDQPRSGGSAAWSIAKQLLEDPSIKKTMHYGCSDITKLAQFAGINVAGFDHDTNKSEYFRDVDAKSYGLDEVTDRRHPEFSGYKHIVNKELLQAVNAPEKILNATPSAQAAYIKKNNLFDISKLSLETLRLYNGADCHVTKLLEIENKKVASQSLMNLYIDLSFILYEMEPNGPYFDYEQNEKLSEIFPYRTKKLLRKLRKIAEDPKFNPGAPQQVSDLLYNKLELEYPFKGKPNTQALALQAMGRTSAAPLLVVDWRKASKAGSTYVTGYKACADLNNGRLRTTWWDTGTRTGRLSSGGAGADKINLQNVHGDPNIQNQCISGNWKQLYQAIKKILVHYSGAAAVAAVETWVIDHPDLEVFLILDYGQIEVRVAAMMSGDKNLRRDCMKPDIHTAVGVTMTGWKAEDIRNDKRVRTNTKNVHFGILFGSEVEGVHNYVTARTPIDQEPMSFEEVEGAFNRYHAEYPGVRLFIDKQRGFGQEHKYVETLFGLKQPLKINDNSEDEEYFQDESKRASYWGNQAVNNPVQGTAHQLLDCGLVNLRRKPKKYRELSIPVMDVHDALYFRVKLIELLVAAKKAKYLMEVESLNTVKSDFPDIKWDIPIVTEAEAGFSLGCKVELTDKTTLGQFCIDWYHQRRKQAIALNKELLAIAASKAAKPVKYL